MDKNNYNKLKVLHLVRWYPNRYDPMPGLFIQRHVEAANLFSKCCVVYTHQIDEYSNSRNTFSIDYSVVNEVPTIKIYYNASRCRIQPLNKLINAYRFIKANNIGIKKINKEIGEPDLLHIHILTRLGLYGLYYRIFCKKPYIITEHWSRYLELTSSFNGYIRKFITRIIVKNASYISAVTENLAIAMQSHRLQNDNYIILPNVVTDAFLRKSSVNESRENKTTFIHVSCFEDKSKNVSGLLRVINNLSKTRDDFIFKLVGDGMDMNWLQKYAGDLGLTDKQIVFTGLLEGEDLVKEMANSDMLVIFSNYENFPVVINESLSLGVPVTATRVGGIPERINELNGVLVNPGDEDQLQLALSDFLDKKVTFDMQNIQKQARAEFSSKSIGKILDGLYQNSLKEIN